MKQNLPKISVVMATYNREKYVGLAIESILRQTYKDFEFIIIDDCSTDNTAKIIQKYAEKDKRISFHQNEKNMGLIYNLNLGFSLAKAKYIARMDDDDIAMPSRFEKQVKFLDKNPDITVLGTFIEPLGDDNVSSWIDLSTPEEIEVSMHFYNPMCHPSVMIRKEFLVKNKLEYSKDALHAEEYDLWARIILNGGKFANLTEPLMQYRIVGNRISTVKESAKIQMKTAEKVSFMLLNRFYKDEKKTKNIIKKIIKYPFKWNNKKFINRILEKMKEHPEEISPKAIEGFEKYYFGKPAEMHIFFAADNKFAPHLNVTIASILKNALPTDFHNFYILDGGISEKNKQRINLVKKIKPCNIEYIKIDGSLFENCPISSYCQHISKQTYYRYIIPKVKPDLDKCFYFDCDIVVEDSLADFWNINLKDNYAAVVEELYKGATEDAEDLNVDVEFNAGIMLINLKKWKKENICNILFKNTDYLIKQNKIKLQDQAVLNYTFKNKVLFVSPKYNLQCNAFYDGKHEKYTEEEMWFSRKYPTIIHYNSCKKPWNGDTHHPYWNKYFKYLKLTNFYHRTIFQRLRKFLFETSDVNSVYRVKILRLTIYKVDKRNYYIKKKLLGIQYKNEFLLRKYLDDKFWYLNESINYLYKEIENMKNQQNNLTIKSK